MTQYRMVGVEEIASSGLILDVTVQNDRKGFAGFAAKGLIDTGASVVCISQRIADRLALRHIDNDDIGVVGGGRIDAKVYSAVLVIDLLGFGAAMPVYAIPMSRGAHDMLLGMSFLRNFLLTLDGPMERFHFYRPHTPLYDEFDG